MNDEALKTERVERVKTEPQGVHAHPFAVYPSETEAEGEVVRLLRIASALSLRDAASRIGWKPIELGALERGAARLVNFRDGVCELAKRWRWTQ